MEQRSDELLDHARDEMTVSLVATYGDRLARDEITAIAETTWDHLQRETRFVTYLPLVARRTSEELVRRRILTGR